MISSSMSCNMRNGLPSVPGTIFDKPVVFTICTMGSRCMLKRLLVVVVLCWSGLAAAQDTILVYGDSLSAAYGISQQKGWVALLQERLRTKQRDYNVVNASISGETSSGGATRIAETLRRTEPDIFILALGANDGLRGLPIAQMKRNLSQ